MLIDSAELTDAFEEESKVRVFLATPRLKLGRAKSAADRASSTAAICPPPAAVQDETDGSKP